MDYDALVGKFSVALRNLAAVSLAIGYPTTASIPHSIANAFKTILAITVACEEYSFEKADSLAISLSGFLRHSRSAGAHQRGGVML